MNKPYFHKISQEEVNKLVKEKKTVEYLLENYKQPDWCKYPEALSMTLGCWSLCDIEKDGLRTKISEEFCKNCPECILYKEDFKEQLTKHVE